MSLLKKVKLNTGASIPQRGYGTWQSKPGEVSEGVFQALRIGYRHLDLAKAYRNQREVAEGIKRAYKELGLKREDIFITSKLWNSQHHPDVVPAALQDTLDELQLEYLDLYLIHWPVAFKSNQDILNLFPLNPEDPNFIAIDDDISIRDTWEAMTKLPKSKVRAVGVSNFSIEHIESIINATDVVPAVSQIERHPSLPNTELVEYCQSKGIIVTGYSVVGAPLAISRQEVKDVATSASKRLGKEVTPAQVILAWAESGGHVVIPKSVSASRIAENFIQIELTDNEIAAINALGRENKRFGMPWKNLKPRWPINVFNTPEEADAPHKVIL
ncbi:putative aldehyde reductase [Xylogone sp. PMI_703]|nr:putative aldehyde reductase [Xylogone sp. PMI_703]